MNGKRFWILSYALHVVLDLARLKRFTLKKTEYSRYEISKVTAYRVLRDMLKAGILRRVGPRSYCVDDSVKERLMKVKQELKLRRAERLYQILNASVCIDLNAAISESVRRAAFKTLGLESEYRYLKAMERVDERMRMKLQREAEAYSLEDLEEPDKRAVYQG